MTDIIIVVTHCPDRACANEIAQALITKKIAACVNIGTESTSIYRWQGQVEQAQELALSIKTHKAHFSQVAMCIRQLHPYDVPEILAVDVVDVDSRYYQWLTEAVDMP